MTKKQRAVLAVEALKQEYPDAICSLTYREPLQLLIATRLSAQCTDARVNMVTPALFERFPTVNDFAEASYDEVAAYIKSCGLFKTKSKDIVEMCKKLRDDFGGEVPDTIEALTTLPGVSASRLSWWTPTASASPRGSDCTSKPTKRRSKWS